MRAYSLTKEQFEVAKMVCAVKGFDGPIEKMEYDHFTKVADELERLNGDDAPKGCYNVCCSVDPSHDINVHTRGSMTYSGKTGEILDSNTDDEWYDCQGDKDHEIVDWMQYEEFCQLALEETNK